MGIIGMKGCRARGRLLSSWDSAAPRTGRSNSWEGAVDPRRRRARWPCVRPSISVVAARQHGESSVAIPLAQAPKRTCSPRASSPTAERTADGLLSERARAGGEAGAVLPIRQPGPDRCPTRSSSATAAGSDRNAPLLVAVDRAISALGVRVVSGSTCRFREERPHWSAACGGSARDRDGLGGKLVRKAQSGRRADACFWVAIPMAAGRRALLAAEEPGLVDGLLLLSYPLHPPPRPAELRTAHFPSPADAGPVLSTAAATPFGLPAEDGSSG